MAMTATAAPSSPPQISTNYSPILCLQRLNTDRLILKSQYRFRLTTSFKRTNLVRASNPRGEDSNGAAANNDAKLLSQEDLVYLVKLGGGSVAGAAAIKYGSILFPQITHPNLLQALIMISAPVVIVTFLLIKQSRDD